jgi:hypothetical protein
MNLSQRLDQARAKREQSAATDEGPTPYDLRMAKDATTYDGRHLRTGEVMTEDRWEELHADDGDGGLPTWNPKRANDLVTIDLSVDITPVGGAVLDLRQPTDDPSTDEVFAMPAWARGEQVFKAPRER